jgi:hypothetical protein
LRGFDSRRLHYRLEIRWFGPATELLDRLRKLPSGGGAEAVREELR